MFRGLIDLFNILIWWCFMYVGSFLLTIVAIFWIIKTNPTPPTPIIHEHINQTVQNIIQPPKRVLVEREVCNSISGCKVVNGTCSTCVIDKIWE